MQENVNNNDHEDDGDQQRYDDFPDALRHGAGRVQWDGVVNPLREPLLLRSQEFFDSIRCRNGIRTRQLIHRDNRARLTVQMADDRIILRSEFHARHILDADDSTIRRCADDDLFKFFRCNQAALRSDRVGKFLPTWRWLAANLTGWVYCILRLDGSDDIGHRDREFCQLVRLHPQPHRVSSGTKHLNTADSLHSAQLIVKIDVGVIRQELRIVDTAGRVEADQHQRRSGCLLHRHAEIGDVGWKLRSSLCLANLGKDQVCIRIGLDVVVDDQPDLAGR